MQQRNVSQALFVAPISLRRGFLSVLLLGLFVTVPGCASEQESESESSDSQDLTSAPLVSAATVFTLAGTGGDPKLVSKYLRGEVTKGNTVVPVTYPNRKVDIDKDMLTGAAILNEKLTTTAGKKIVFAHSLGAVVSSCWLRQYGPKSTINPAELEFILIGNSVRPYNGFYTLNDFTQTDGKPFVKRDLVSPIADTRYPVRDIAIQYDGWADWPNLNVKASIDNANGGKLVYHLMYDRFPLDRSDYRKYVEGKITYTLIPVKQWWSSASSLAKIETGYQRPD